MQTGASISTLRANRQRSGEFLLPLVTLVAATAGFAAVSNAQATPGKQSCDAFASLAAPKADRPMKAEGQALQSGGCDPLGIYYEGHGEVRFVAARKCALAAEGLYQDATPEQVKASGGAQAEDTDTVPDTVVLAMLYANGEGVPRDAAMAKHYLCEDNAWNDPNDSIGDIAPGRKFEACNPDGTSSYGRVMDYACLIEGKNRADKAQGDTYGRVEASTPADARPALRALEKAWQAYTDAHGAESPGGTSGAAQSAMETALGEQVQWTGYLARVAEGELPSKFGDGTDLPGVDRKLNAQYQVVLKQAATDCPTGGTACLGPDDLRKAERAWLQYREAWVAFGQVRFPRIPAAAWRAWLTRSREGDLEAD